ncbi:hypothetical protein [Actinoplanes regularis]|uniref:hypothetical protein n=1 Tax=Actinoplanes regularis TaxID=52697 RepID=UPI0024A16F32|nr:hypothetical protein [Actinoplanes regularis]GLW31845.1 hypothetical protein Areg01_47840 [Actinoplanes regularis]
MSSTPVTVRRIALVAPVLLLLYGILRFADGLDGDRGNGPLWTIGHLAFFVGMVLFGWLMLALRGMVPRPGRLAAIATVTGLAGVLCFLWVIAGDLSDGFREAAPLPAALEFVGPMLFPVGMLTLFGLLVAARRLPVWTPLLFGAAITAITVNLNLLPFAALAVLAALSPLRRLTQPSRGLAAVRN